jgi:polar amino acid transport system substrate-binding protein
MVPMAGVVRLVLAVLLSLLLWAPAARAGERPLVRSGWHPWEPYQFRSRGDSATQITGLDVELFRAVFEDELGMDLSLPEISWQKQLQLLELGDLDVASGAFRTPERERWALFSAPYRTEEVVIFSREGEIRLENEADLERLLERSTLRIGIVAGYHYGDRIARFERQYATSARLVKAQDELENLRNLVEGRVDAVPIDRVVGATIVWRQHWQDELKSNRLVLFRGPVHAIFSRRSVDPTVVTRFDAAMKRLRRNGRYNRLVRNGLFPVLLEQTVGQRWFLGLEILGTVAFAGSGVLLAQRDRFSLVGALVMAGLPAVGGGLIRDVMIDRSQPAVLRSPLSLVLVLGMVLLAFLLSRLIPKGRRLPDWLRIGSVVELLDAVGLAAFTVVGVMVAVETGCDPLLLWGPVLSAITTAGGTVLRDIVRGDPEHPALRRVIYAEIALVWGFALSLFLFHYADSPSHDPITVQLAVLVTMLGTFLSRLLVLHLRLEAPRLR